MKFDGTRAKLSSLKSLQPQLIFHHSNMGGYFCRAAERALSLRTSVFGSHGNNYDADAFLVTSFSKVMIYINLF